MITIPGQLAIKTIHGRNGDFSVGRLATSIGEFVVKNAELDQYAEGKYEAISPSRRFAVPYTANGRMVIEIRALLGGMTLSAIDALSRDDARRLSRRKSIRSTRKRRPPRRRRRPPLRRPAGRRHAVRATPGRYHAVRQRTGCCVCRPAAMPTTATTRCCSVRSGRWAMSSSSMPPWIGACCVSSATALGELGYEFAPLSQDWHLARV